MIKKTVTYEDFNGEETTEDVYFNLTKAELIEYEVREKGGMSSVLERISKSDDGNLIMQTFKDILLMSYGEKSDDGRRFRKNEQIREDFASSMAYDAIFWELCTDADSAAAFVNGLVPKKLLEEAQKEQQKAESPTLSAIPTEKPQDGMMTREQLEAKLAEMKKGQE